jgi:hypothetical protein
MNWKIFGLKYDHRETWAFEQMSYLLFCAEFNSRIGLFRYKNQTGIETEPIEKDGKYYGFQSKYYTTSIAVNKDNIIDSIKKAKSKNKQLDEILFYINQELSESTTKSKKKSQYQLDIEKAAKTEGINIQWRVPSHLELQLSLPDNKYINNIFFSLDPNEGDLLDEISKHNENILQAIQTEISFGDKQIKIDRSFISELQQNNNDATILKDMIRLSHGLGKRVIAEGIETEEQQDMLQKLGCDMMQGYFYSPPMRLQFAEQFIERQIKSNKKPLPPGEFATAF